VKQGIVLSPALFLLVMDPLLKQLLASRMGLTVNNLYAGGFLHADDIKTLATCEASLHQQVELVKEFASMNLLKFSVSKCEIVVFSKQHYISAPVCDVDGLVIPVSNVEKCLRYWWKGDLSALRSVEENLQKAHWAFFIFWRIGAFQHNISPLSSREIIETFVTPVLLYGSDNWILMRPF